MTSRPLFCFSNRALHGLGYQVGTLVLAVAFGATAHGQSESDIQSNQIPNHARQSSDKPNDTARKMDAAQHELIFPTSELDEMLKNQEVESPGSLFPNNGTHGTQNHLPSPANTHPQDIPSVNSPQDEVWGLILDEYKAANEVRLLEIRIKNLLDAEIQRKKRLNEAKRNAESQLTNSADSPATQSQSDPTVANTNTGDLESTNIANPVIETEAASTNSISAASSKRILSTPPDRLALADSLFLSGDAKVALELYEGLKNEDDDGWIQFQSGCCLRRLGRWEEGRTLLREVAESTTETSWVVNSRWWLDVEDRKLAIQRELNTFETFIESRKNELNTDTPGTGPDSRTAGRTDPNLR